MSSPSTAATCVIFFPGALGDFLCFLPTAQAIQRSLRGPLTLVTHAAYAPLLDPARFAVVSIDGRTIAALYGQSPLPPAAFPLADFDRILSWTGSRDARFRSNLEALGAGRARVFPFRGFRTGQHARDYFAQCVGIERDTHAEIRIACSSRRWADRLLAGSDPGTNWLALHPGSGSQRKNWMGMADLAVEWQRRGGRVVGLFGPAEGSSDLPRCDLAVRNQPLDHVAAILERMPLFVGNDSGIAHLAAAQSCCGCALFADSDPTTWRPGGSVAVLQAARHCGVCDNDRFCTHRLPLETVLRRIEVAYAPNSMRRDRNGRHRLHLPSRKR